MKAYLIVDIISSPNCLSQNKAKFIQIAGLSAGGALAGILSSTYPDVFAAIGIHSGTVYQAATSVEAGLRAMRGDGPDPEQQGQLAYQAMSVKRTR